MTIRSQEADANDAQSELLLDRLPQRGVLADEVYQIIRDSLLSHRIKPGTRLNLDQLARELHVSNTPVRQALGRLESDGLVTKEPYRGFTASPVLDSRTIAELYDYRLLIEPPTAARATRRRRDEFLSTLEALCDVDEINRLVAAADSDPAAEDTIGARDIEFHCVIAHEAGNSFLADNLAAALTRMRLYTIYHRHGAGEQAWSEHREVVAAIRAGDPDAAASAMRAHLMCGLERLRSVIS